MSNLKIKFDTAGNPEMPTFILAKRNGEKLGLISAKHIIVSGDLMNPSEFSFEVYKYDESNGEKIKNIYWDYIVDFKFVWLKEYDKWYQITINKDESDETKKSVSGVQACQAELSQIMIFTTEINTELDISREEYEIPTTFYNVDHPEASLLDRLMEKAPHYRIAHVDSSLTKIQRTFSFDNKSLYDCFAEISEEIGCLFLYKSESDENGNLDRAIYVYDLQNYCSACGYRGDFESKCPECNSTNIKLGYGNDTNIFVTSDELGNDINFSTNTDSVKNCFKLEAGDDLMTATIRNCNPNGTDYIWYISDDMKKEMSDELVQKLTDYDTQYKYYSEQRSVAINSSMLTSYNNLIQKYLTYNSGLKKIATSIVGYSNLMVAYYNTIDFALYLQSELMPNVTISSTTAKNEVSKLTSQSLSPVAVEDVSIISLATANSAVLKMAKTLVRSTYQVKVVSSEMLNANTWSGIFKVTNYSDEEDTYTSNKMSVTINDDYETYVRQLINKSLSNQQDDEDAVDISALFKLTLDKFKTELKKYCLARLESFYDACQACINIMIEQGVASGDTWSNSESSTDVNLYDDLYMPYYNKLHEIENEIKVRENEIKIVVGEYDTNGYLIEKGVQSYIIDEIETIQNALNFEKYLGEKLWLEFISFRREDKYTNQNYISDGLTNAELFAHALEFIKVAKNEIFKSSELQHSISSSLKNLLVIKKFEKLVNSFELGNWIRVQIDDEVYKLRLIHFQIDYDNIENIDVDFSDVTKTAFGMTDKQALMDNIANMTTTYDSVKRQASQVTETKRQLSQWVSDGLNLTKTRIIDNADEQNISWDEHGFLCRKFNQITETYNDKQLKIINSGLYLTDDNWLTSRAGIGNFIFYNPKTERLEESYGVIADTLVGSLILGEEVGIYTPDGSITLDNNGLTINSGATDDTRKLFTINSTVLNEDGTEEDLVLLYVDNSGHLVLNGNVRFSAVGGNDESTLSSIVTDMRTETNDSLNNLKTATNRTLNQVYNDSTNYASSILEEYKTDVGQYMTFDQTGLTLGATTSVFSTVVDNQGIFFKESNQIVAYVTNQQLYIPSAVIESDMTIGNFAFVNRNDGGFSIVWKDDYALVRITASCSMKEILVGRDFSEIKGIIVKAVYDNDSTSIVTRYTMSSGTIKKGTNTITVTYKEMSATFTITGVETVENTGSGGTNTGYDGDYDVNDNYDDD